MSRAEQARTGYVVLFAASVTLIATLCAFVFTEPAPPEMFTATCAGQELRIEGDVFIVHSPGCLEFRGATSSYICNCTSASKVVPR